MTDTPLKVAILGCGPAGLFAAHAAAQAGAEFTIFSKPRKSFMRGAQYLHKPIPGLSGDAFDVTYELWGSVAGYREKVYGEMEDILVSPETLVGTSPAWDIREAYDNAWDLYADPHDGSRTIVPVDYETGHDSVHLDMMSGDYDLVISSIPAWLLCRNPDHKFESTEVWATEGLKSFKDPTFWPPHSGPDGRVDNIVVCSGDPDDWWYRQSRIHGWENTEFPLDRKPAVPDGYKVHKVTKPVRTDCDCHPDIVRVGRYGQWKKGVLTHHAYEDSVLALVAAEQRGAEMVETFGGIRVDGWPFVGDDR